MSFYTILNEKLICSDALSATASTLSATDRDALSATGVKWVWYNTELDAQALFTALPEGVSVPTLAARQTTVWNKIAIERDRRKFLGVKVGTVWLQSDADSRTQQLGLVLVGASIPAGLQWKTLSAGDGLHNPVYVTMTPALAQAIFAATIASDFAVFAAAEVHRVNMLKVATPEVYDYSTGWPVAFGDSNA